MRKYDYDVFAFRQQAKAPIQVAFVASAEDVLKWAGVPRKSDELLTGYQRFRDPDRIDREIVPFFQDPANCSPTALIVALRRDSGLGSCVLSNTDIQAGEVASARLTISIDDEKIDNDAIFVDALAYVNKRLGIDDPNSDPEGNSELLTSEEDEDEEEIAGMDEPDQSEDESTDDEEIMHLGSVTLARMKELLENRENWSNSAFRTSIADYVKPAFLIDGQHRVSAGARFGSSGLPFMVCGLYDAPWEEQVFQFTVVNLKPKRIPPSLITAIAGLSLTRTEHEAIQKRLTSAGVPVAEVEIMSLVAYDERSPFYEMLDMGVGGPTKRTMLLGYGGMKRIAKGWYAVSRPSLMQIAMRMAAVKSKSKARERWHRERTWFDFFCSFWGAIRDRYPGLWAKSDNNKLFVAAHLWALQEVLLTEADGQVKSHWQLDESVEDEQREVLLRSKLLEVVNTTLDYFPEEMWTRTWKGSQDTAAGRRELVDLFKQFVNEGKTTGGVWRNWKKSAWFPPVG